MPAPSTLRSSPSIRTPAPSSDREREPSRPRWPRDISPAPSPRRVRAARPAERCSRCRARSRSPPGRASRSATRMASAIPPRSGPFSVATGRSPTPSALVSACRRYDLGTSDDLDLWLLWAASEYALSTRDFAFLASEIPYFGTDSGALWDHLKLAFAHLEQVVGTGPHGEYLTGPSGATGDWSDFSTEFLQMTESNLVTAQAAYIYPRLALVADAVGDESFAGQLRAAAARDLAVVARERVPGGWFARGYSGARQIGVGAIYEEPQPWALLAGAATPEQAAETVAAYRRYLAGVGAPPELHGPSLIGSAIAPASNDPGASEQSEPPVRSEERRVGKGC